MREMRNMKDSWKILIVGSRERAFLNSTIPSDTRRRNRVPWGANDRLIWVALCTQGLKDHDSVLKSDSSDSLQWQL